jgi:hypothetical protein
VEVGTVGNSPATVSPGETKQLWAVAKYSNATSSDVTNVALWQSSNPTVATVSSGGLLSAAIEGTIDVMATYNGVQGALHADIRKLGCEATTLSPVALTFGPFGGGSGNVLVTAPVSDCRWTARSDSDWLQFRYDPQRSGTGFFSNFVPSNNYPMARTANIVVSVGGTQVIHAISQEQPSSCSYVVTPDEARFSAAGGTGAFDVVTTPGDCQWTATSDYRFYGVNLTGATSGKGTGRVTYSVASSTRAFEVAAPIRVAGLSGANPPAVHTAHIAAR